MLNTGTSPHSIKAIAFVCEFDSQVSAAGLELVAAEYKRFRNRLLLREPIQNLEFQFKGSAKLLQQKNNISGYRFSTKAPDNTDSAWFEVSNNRVLYCTTDYVNFASFATDVIYYIGIALKAFAKTDGKIIRATLEYRDEFQSDKIDWPPYDTLREENKYIAKAAITHGMLWHNHIGFFSECRLGLLLNQVRAEHIQTGTEEYEDIQYKLALTLTHILSDAPFFRDITDSKSEEFELILSELRNQHKKVLLDIITEKQAELIGLKPIQEERP